MLFFDLGDELGRGCIVLSESAMRRVPKPALLSPEHRTRHAPHDSIRAVDQWHRTFETRVADIPLDRPRPSPARNPLSRIAPQWTKGRPWFGRLLRPDQEYTFRAQDTSQRALARSVTDSSALFSGRLRRASCRRASSDHAASCP